jgi:hypothetical protein
MIKRKKLINDLNINRIIFIEVINDIRHIFWQLMTFLYEEKYII